MLTAVKNQIKVCVLSMKYNIMKEMLNRVTFCTNILFMILNNASFIVQWLILFRLKDYIGGFTMREVMLLWGLAAGSFGLANVLFARVFSLSGLIINGKLDSYLVQPKNVLLSMMTSATNVSSIGDVLYGVIILCIFGKSIREYLLFFFFTVTGAAVLTAFALLMGSLSFWFVRADLFTDSLINIMLTFSTYPDGIFKGAVKFILYFAVPVGMAVYLPVHVITDLNVGGLFTVTGYTILIWAIAVPVFYRGLRRYSSGNLMEARM